MKSYRIRERLHDELLPHLLLARGIDTTAHEHFLNPDFERDSHDPYLLPDMGAAVERIMSARATGERIAVWSDYDCDGIPGGVMLAEFLRGIGLSVVHYIPHRHKEGYGLNQEGIDELVAQGTTLMITLDLGTSDVEQIAYAKQKGLDTIVTDHHLAHSALPPCLVINPKRADSTYPFADLCGSGVAWKLVQALLQKDRALMPEGQEKWLLDLVGLATLSDMVPLVGENRMLARYGLLVMRRGRRPGLSALLKLLRIKPRSLSEDDIGFMVAPRINAASRMDNPWLAAELLAATSEERAGELALKLNRINDERKGTVASIIKEVHKRSKGMDFSASPVIVMGSVGWRPGVLGLVANKLVEEHKKPVCLWGKEGGDVVRGSCRSDGTVNIVDLMSAASDVFEGFGGHTGSGGFSIAEERVHELPARLAAAHRSLVQSPGALEVVLDRELDLSEVDHTYRDLQRLSPFGTGFEKPLFMFPGLHVSDARMFGKAQDHLELTLSRSGARVSGITFFATPDSFSKKFTLGEKSDVVGHVEMDWRGKPRLRVIDII
jgi:single-stranded-DNA-specific exonuclease